MSEQLHNSRDRRALRNLRKNMELHDVHKQEAMQLAVRTMAAREQLTKEAECLTTITNASTDLWFKNIVELDYYDKVAQKIEDTFVCIEQGEQADTIKIGTFERF